MVNKAKPLIGVTAGEIQNKERPHAPITYGQSHTYIDSVIAAGGVPVVLPITNDTTVIEVLYDKIDGFLFAGGNDIDPTLYSEQISSKVVDYSPFRDKFELSLLQKVLKGNKPMLAICRGMQLLNIAQGGTLYQDIPTDLPDASDHELSINHGDEESLTHVLRIDQKSRLAKILTSTEVPTNTYHHQAIKHLGKDLYETAWASDGVIEAVEMNSSKDRFVIAVQSHPESLLAVEPRWKLLFEAFVNECRS